MHGPTEYDLQAAAASAGDEGDIDCELRILRDVFRLLPSGVTVQDDRGNLLLVNDAAASVLKIAAIAAPSQLSDRQKTCLELLRAGRSIVMEEALTSGAAKRVFLTAHRPVQIGKRNLLLSTSADITEQKAFEGPNCSAPPITTS